jgi:4-hydroxybenzoate polyprenyltransferase
MARHAPPDPVVRDASWGREASRRPAALNLLISLRPGQWTKNLFVFAGLIFGQKLFDADAFVRAGVAFLIFCALSGVVYLANDIVDRERDRRHPHKARRPIASGAISPGTATTAAIVLGLAALTAALWLGRSFALVAITYLGLLLFYSGSLKHIVIIDVLTIAVGFVLRAMAGAVAVEVPMSNWLLVCTILLALFLALSKRRHELVLLAEGATEHRRSLADYSPYLLDQMIGVVTASTLIAYIFYTVSPETELRFGTNLLGLTIPFVLYGIFRYLYLVHRKEGGGSPAEMLVTDRPLLVCVGLWTAAVILLIYQPFRS